MHYVEDDNIVTWAEQCNAWVENDARAQRVKMRARQVEIVGANRVAPTKLIVLLPERGVLQPSAPTRLSAFQ